MSKKFPEYKKFDLSEINNEINRAWSEKRIFEKSVESREGEPTFVFNEGPPSANGIPGIHHVMARTIKDIFCRYKTMQGFQVKRKAGWDTHGLPVELGVEKSLNITRDDIGTKISIEEFNTACRKDVMKYTDMWEELTEIMGYWINLDDPYITYENKYIETVWYLLKELYKKDLLYKGYSIQPYSPAAGTGLSTHELNQPGCYRDVKDTTIVAQFKVVKNDHSAALIESTDTELYILAWTTTPWTLPSNTALTVGANIEYTLVRTFNPYTGIPITVIVAKELMGRYFPEKEAAMPLDEYEPGSKHVPYKVLTSIQGKELEGLNYEQLLDWVNPPGKAFVVLTGDFVTTEEGTGVVHTAPTFGADDYKVAMANDIASITVMDKGGLLQPLVDRNGRFFRLKDLDPDFVKEHINLNSYGDFAGKYVKNEYDDSKSKGDPTIDVDIAVHLKLANKAFRIEKHVHNYPHCWRTDKPVLYYPLDSWFVRTTAMKDRMMELNDTIDWKPDSTGTGRFGKWLENLVDWNLSRARFWGTPLPIWITEDKKEQICIGSVEELKQEIEKSVSAGYMQSNALEAFVEGDFSKNNYDLFDLHRPFVDDLILVSETGQKMFREPVLIDAWFDSGSMPYAQYHYPFENKQNFDELFPADFIAEGVDQTRGWFFTLHAISTMLFDSVSFKNVISNGLVLDKSGNKMSKRLGNGVDPFQAIEKHGSDPLRWYMITNAQPWDNLKFDESGVDEVKRKFFGTLYNTYSFFALYANVDGFSYEAGEVPVTDRPEIDRWIISLLNSLVREVKGHYECYEPTRAARLIQEFVLENLSNWYVRLNRKRFWGGLFDEDKRAAYQTLYTCLETVAMISAPIAPFFMDKLFNDLNNVTKRHREGCVHLTTFPPYDEGLIDTALEGRMDVAQKLSSMILGLRRKVNIKVRQPLNRMMLPVSDPLFREQVEGVKTLVLNEVNVKEIEYISDTAGILIKRIKPNFKTLGPRYGKLMKEIGAAINGMEQEHIAAFEKDHSFEIVAGGENIQLTLEDVEIVSEDIPGWLVANEGAITVALDIKISEGLRLEGIARELVNRIQIIRKDSGFEMTDRIRVLIKKHELINDAIEIHGKYIGSQTLADSVSLADGLEKSRSKRIEIEDGVILNIQVTRV